MRILLGVPTGGNPCPEMMETVHSITKNSKHEIDIAIETRKPTPRARNDLLTKAINGDYDYLLMVDDDNPFDAKHIDGIFYGDVCVGAVPRRTANGWNWGTEETILKLPRDFGQSCYTELQSAGFGIVALSRACMIKMYQEYKGSPFDYGVIRENKMTMRRRGEDATFVERFRKLGGTIWGYSKIVAKHKKDYFIEPEKEQMFQSPKLTIAVPVHNQLKYTSNIVGILKKFELPFEREVLIIDDGSKDETENRLYGNCPKDRFKIIHQENAGVNKTWNKAISLSQGEFICVINNDIEFDESCVLDMMKELEQNDKTFCVSPYETTEKFPTPFIREHNINGSCRMIRAKNRNKIGPIPETMLHFYGDNFIYEKVRQLGYFTTIANTFFHYGSQTVLSLKDVNSITHKDGLAFIEWLAKNNLHSQSFKNDIFHYMYYWNSFRKSDINEHLPTLKKLAEDCKTVTEMGTRDAVSIRAFLVTKAKVRAYDIALYDGAKEMLKICREKNRQVDFYQTDVLKTEIEETDLLFIDTRHTGDQLRAELELHGDKAQKYLVFHDTVSFGYKDEDLHTANGEIIKGTGGGLRPAINEFMETRPYWVIKENRENNNGLLVLERKGK